MPLLNDGFTQFNEETTEIGGISGSFRFNFVTPYIFYLGDFV